MSYNVVLFGIKMKINPIAFSLPIGKGWDVYWYGILIALGFLLAIVYAYFNAKRFGIDIDKLLDVILVATPVSVLGARLYYILFMSDMSIKEFFNFSGGGFAGLAIYGAVIGAAVSGGLMCIVRKLKILDVFDVTAIGFLIGQSVGRWGNFVNQEAFGCATGSSWFGMGSENVYSELGSGVLAHPCFLYESLWCALGVLLLHKLSKNRKFSGQIALSYCVWYGFGRGIIEILRTDSLYIGKIKVSCLLSFLLFAGALAVLLIIRNKHRNKDNAADEYVSQFTEEKTEEQENV